MFTHCQVLTPAFFIQSLGNLFSFMFFTEFRMQLSNFFSYVILYVIKATHYVVILYYFIFPPNNLLDKDGYKIQAFEALAF